MTSTSNDNSLKSNSSSSSSSSLASLSKSSQSASSHSGGYTKSEWISRKFAHSMIWSDCGLSLFEYPLNRQKADSVCTQLTALPFKILGVWVVARPLSYDGKGKFQHWAIKVHAPPCLISLDWLEVKKKGFIRFEQHPVSGAYLSDFLYFFYTDQTTGERVHTPWKILASVTPSPLRNKFYAVKNALDEEDACVIKETLRLRRFHDSKAQKAMQPKSEAVEEKENNNNDVSPSSKDTAAFDAFTEQIDCKKRVCDIASFIEDWVHLNHQSSIKKGTQERGYNAVINNCQQFAADLFYFLVGAQYQKKAKKVNDLRDIQT